MVFVVNGDGFVLGMVLCVSMHQCRFGAPSVKPTNIASNDPHFEALACRCNHAGGHAGLIGINESGGFRTTPAARYPAGLCDFIAAKFVRWYSAKLDSGAQIPNAFPILPWEHLLFHSELSKDERYKARPMPQH